MPKQSYTVKETTGVESMKIVFLDAKTIGEDIDLSDYDKPGSGG